MPASKIPATRDLAPDLPWIFVPTRRAWRQWLANNGFTSSGAWVVTYKKSSVPEGSRYVSAIDINEECLCFGWIDSKPGKVDDERTALLCTPRKPGSGWSRVNKERIERLMEQDQIAPPGLAAIELAKKDGSWDLLNEIDALVEPKDLAQALASSASARLAWDAFPPSTRRGILEWIAQAKKDETRAERIAKTIASAERGERVLQWKPKG